MYVLIGLCMQVAHDNYLALQDFFKKFDIYKDNEFFITGESYGGVYVPTLSALVVDDKSMNFQVSSVNKFFTGKWYRCLLVVLACERLYLTLRAPLSSTFLQTLPDLVTPLRAFFISTQLSTDAVSALRKFQVLI